MRNLLETAFKSVVNMMPPPAYLAALLKMKKGLLKRETKKSKSIFRFYLILFFGKLQVFSCISTYWFLFIFCEKGRSPALGGIRMVRYGK